MYSRRHFLKIAAAGLAMSTKLAAKINSRVHGVRIGFTPIAFAICATRQSSPRCGKLAWENANSGRCKSSRTRSEVVDIANWRSTISLDFFTNVREKFNQAGIDIYAYNPTFGGPDRRSGGTAGKPPPLFPHLSRTKKLTAFFRWRKRLAQKPSILNSPELATRIALFAEKYKMVLGIFSLSPDADLLAMSKYFRYDFDIGDYTRLGHDALKFVQDNHDQLTDIHLKDCKFKGVSMPFGLGDSHMKEILQFLKKNRSQIRAHIDCDYPGTGTSGEEIQKCYDYVKECLA